MLGSVLAPFHMDHGSVGITTYYKFRLSSHLFGHLYISLLEMVWPHRLQIDVIYLNIASLGDLESLMESQTACAVDYPR